MQRTTFTLVQVVTLVVRDKIEDGSLRQGGRLIEQKPTLLHACPKRTHGATLRLQGCARQGRSQSCLKPPLGATKLAGAYKSDRFPVGTPLHFIPISHTFLRSFEQVSVVRIPGFSRRDVFGACEIDAGAYPGGDGLATPTNSLSNRDCTLKS